MGRASCQAARRNLPRKRVPSRPSSFDPASSYYKVSALDIHGNESGYALLRPDDIAGLSNPPSVPAVSLLEQNVPNPFNPATVIRYAVARPGQVELVVYDVTGRPVRVLVQGLKAADRDALGRRRVCPRV